VATASAVAASFSVRDFLEVDASQIGSGSVALGGPGQGSVPVQAVDPSAVTSVTLSKQSDANASKGETLYVFARAGDAQGADVFGASFDWEVNGARLTAQSMFAGGPTDMLTYQYDPSTSETRELLVDDDGPRRPRDDGVDLVGGHGGMLGGARRGRGRRRRRGRALRDGGGGDGVAEARSSRLRGVESLSPRSREDTRS
jgi:hypothetical protein